MKSLRAVVVALGLFATVAHAETLPNGLRVIIEPDPTVNSIVVHVRYRGGYVENANTVVVDDADHDARLDAIGGYAVSSVEAHHTEVFEVVPAGALELALWFEAKRMAIHSGGVPQTAPFQPPVDVAIDRLLGRERRAHDQPQARLSPANATLVIAGRVDRKTALAQVQRYFGGLSRGAAVSLVRDRPSTDRYAEVDGPESATVIAVPVAEVALALVVEQRLLAEGVDAEMRDELRVAGDSNLEMQMTAALVTSTDEQVSRARKAAEVKLLLKLEALPYRARVLASGLDVDKLRKRIARVTTEQVRAFADSSRDTSITIQVRQR